MCSPFCWLAGQGSLSGIKTSQSQYMQSDFSSMFQGNSSATQNFPLQTDRPWADNLRRNLSLDAPPSHMGVAPSGSGIEPSHLAHQLEQLELQHLQKLDSTGSGLQRQVSGVPPALQPSDPSFDHFLRQGVLPNRDPQTLNPIHAQVPPQPHQLPVQIPPSGPVLELLLRLQQQQQQQQQLPPQVLLKLSSCWSFL